MIKQIFKTTYKLTDDQMNKFDVFSNYLKEENKKYNLTSIIDDEQIFEKHFYDSCSASLAFNFENKTILDVGSGGGMPGIPLAICNNLQEISFLDSNNKKITFLNSACDLLKINHKCIYGRAEETNLNYDVIIARGVAQLNILLELCSNLVKKGGTLIAMKGSNYKEELNNSQNALNKLGFDLVNIQEYKLPIENSVHCNLFFNKINDHDAKYPRQFSQIKKKPL